MKYKHIATGKVVEQCGDKYISFEPKDEYPIPNWIVENSKDWQKLDKQWTILALGTIKDYYTNINNEWITQMGKASTWFTYEKGLEVLPIYAVRRESDNEIFTIGDKIKLFTGHHHVHIKIASFLKTSDDKIFAFGDGCSGELSTATKISALVITEDGKEIYDGDENVYIVIMGAERYHIYEYKVKVCLEYTGKIFANKGKAEEYILKSKVCLSYYDVEKIIPIHSEYELLKLVTTKINK